MQFQGIRLVLSLAIGCGLSGYLVGAERLDLRPRSDSRVLSRVTIDLDAGGHSFIRQQAKEAKELSQGLAKEEGSEQGAEQKLPISVVGKLVYDELRLPQAPEAASGGLDTLLALRHYETAEAVIKVGNAGRTPKLVPALRLVAVEQGADRPLLYCPKATIDRDQLDLIDVVGNSVAVDRLLPREPVVEGASWPNDAEVMRSLLALETIAVCEVQSVVDSSNQGYVKLRLAGVVHGSADGAAVEQDVRGVYLFNRHERRITRLNLAVREKRSIGGATPGLDVVAKVQVTIDPIQESPNLNEAILAEVKQLRRESAGQLQYESLPLGFRFRHGRQWYLTAEGRESVTFRRIDNGDLAAQCTISRLPSKSAGQQTSLEEFQNDIRYSLGKNFGEFVSSREWRNAASLNCFEAVVRGLVDEVPVEWHYFLVAPESGPRVAATVTIEKPYVERVASSDRELIESMQFFPAMPAAQTAAQTAAQPTATSPR
ncbi:MAG: hypothetical protein IT425_15345 [Pirellulales bacterium]|nr:hypothetical protein [Pirellulales bacterium]